VVVLTVSALEPLTDPEVAEIVVCPTEALVARPVAVMGATATFEDTHVETLVTSCTVPSVKVPLALNRCAAPSRIVGLEGATVMDTNAAGVTSSCVDPETEAEVAVIVVLPMATLVTRPALPGVLLTVATGPVEDVQ